ncbi:UNVERIFIED_CONTAM: Integrator complex subunit 2 [Siphonaria sp. JEL0065]|nr:Integrator complex subunit 2 [Siphonaria sp. JEL0065]
MRLVSAFVGYFKLKLTAEEALYCLHFISAPGKQSSVRLVKLNLCALIVGAEQFIAVSLEKYIEALLKVTQTDKSEFTLMTGVFCHTNQLIELLNLVRSVLNVQITMAPDALSRLRTIFTEKMLSDVDIAYRSLSLQEFTSQVERRGSLDVVVVHELLKAGIFKRAKIDIKEWVLQSIRHLKPPYHNKFLDLIKLYVDWYYIVDFHMQY